MADNKDGQMQPASVQPGQRLTHLTLTIPPSEKKKTGEEEKEENKGETKVRPRGEIRLQDPRKKQSGKNNKGPITADKLAKRRGYN